MPQRGPRTHPLVRDYIRERVQAGDTAADVIKRGAPAGLEGHWPQSDRTIQALVKRYRPPAIDPASRWTLDPASDDDPRPILRALRAVIEASEGRIQYFSQEEAGWIAAIARAAPDIEATPDSGWTMAMMARAYINAHRQGFDPVGLDHALAYGGLGRAEHGDAWARGVAARIPNEIWHVR